MGHPSKKVLQHVEGTTNGFTPNISFPTKDKICPGCVQGKAKNQSFPLSIKRATQPLELIHADLIELPIKFYHKSKYVLTLLDDFSAYAECIPLRSKSDTLKALKSWITLMENQTSKTTKCFRSDRGGEFTGQAFSEYLSSKGIKRETSAPHIHQQNGRAERFNQTIMDKAESLRLHASIPESWWEFSIETAVYLYNRTPSRRTLKAQRICKSPFQLLYGQKPDVHHLKVFGCLAWVFIPKEMRKNKLSPKSEAMTFIGYEKGSKAYKFMRKDNSIFIGVKGSFDEEKFPRARSEKGHKDKLIISPPLETMNQEEIHIPTNPKTDHTNDDSHSTSSDTTSSDEQTSSSDEESSMKEESEYGSVKSEDEVEDLVKSSGESSGGAGPSDRSSEESDNGSASGSDSEERPEETPPSPEPVLRRSGRIPKPVVRSDSAYGTKPATSVDKMKDREWQKTMEPSTSSKHINIATHDDIEQLIKEGGNKFVNFLLAQMITDKNPREMQYRDILRMKDSNPNAYSEWHKAMESEIQALEERKVWELVDLPQDRKPIKCRWVYDVKTDGRKRGRLVAKGFSQIHGIDFEETFSPVARFETVRLLLAVSALEDWEIEALDVKTAFLYGELDEELYMEQPEGFQVKGQERKVYRLRKALYGLKQASLAWNKQAHKSLLNLGFKRCLSDTGIYTCINGKDTLIVILYVDDVLFLGNNKKLLFQKKAEFMKKWECRDLGPITEYLRMKIVRDRTKKELIIDQIDYARKVVERFGQQDARPTYTPLPVGYNPKAQPKEIQAKPEQRSFYQSIIGSLLFLAIGTRADIAHATILMSQFMVNPSEEHIKNALHIVRYVNTYLHIRVKYNGLSGEGFIAFADADWAADPDTCKSTTGYIIKLAQGAVSWVSRKQKTVALSSTEAEYMCVSDTARQAAWIKSLFSEIGFTIEPIMTWCDNQGAIFLANNPAQEHRSKHIDIRYHYIRECISDGKIKLQHISTTEQVADIMTKCLSRDKFNHFRNQLGISIAERGGVLKQ